MQSYTIMYVLLCSLHSICRFSFNYSIKVIVVLTTFSIISIPYLLNSVLQPYFMPIYSIILLYLFICNMSHVLEINYLILSYLILYIYIYICTFCAFSHDCNCQPSLDATSPLIFFTIISSVVLFQFSL